jgi:hypothetical protein
VRKDRVGPLAVLLVIAALGLFMWMTRYPESPLLSEAVEWPVVGPLVERFRERYLDAPEPTPTQIDAPEASVRRERPPSAPTRRREQRPTVWVNTGTPLLAAPESDAEAVMTVARIASLPVVEQRGEWYRVVYRGTPAWVDLPGYDDSDMPPFGREPSPPLPLPGRPADEHLLQMATELLGESAVEVPLAGYVLITDRDDPELLEMLARVAGALEASYAARYGVELIDRPRETVVLFSQESAYRRFQDRLDRVAGLPAAGLVSKGLVAVFVGGRARSEVAATLVHELAHLLNRRALGPALPPWLDEGIADDLAYSAISGDGSLDPTMLAGSWRDVGPVRVWLGGHASARELERAVSNQSTVPLDDLLRMEWEEFVDPEGNVNYPQSAFFLRFLIDVDPVLRTGFRRFLTGIAAGGPVTAEELVRRLGRSEEQLEAEFSRWLPDTLARLTAAGDRRKRRRS